MIGASLHSAISGSPGIEILCATTPVSGNWFAVPDWHSN